MVTKANKEDVTFVAQLHYKTITGGFLTKLGISFLNSLYMYLIKNEMVLVYKENEQVKGFVSCSLNTEGMMKRFLFSNPEALLMILWIVIKKPKTLVPLFETFRAPVKSKKTEQKTIILPVTELLSISVDPSAQKGSIGTQLLNALENELKLIGIRKYKVIAGESLIGANKFYQKNGFILYSTFTIHGKSQSNIYTKLLD